jgi:hypothetical protein
MAKSSVPGLDRIRDLFTSAEQAVLESTAGKTLLAHSRKQLDATLAQARALRDKWRDLHASQTRTTKRSTAGAGSAANVRSREKSDMFAAAIERVQARLAEVGIVAPAAKAAAPRKASAAKRPTKAARTAGHRAERATVKAALATLAEKPKTKPKTKRKGAKASRPRRG